ncbi:GNAT family N-acetyltransferase [Herbidospora mongoliensis]|uniref:GNAT family N-acetyltransferase n=1 Tax=Herbidospora mongoliensis TaxID=688067 RepID=UPI00082FC436|nr:N-acetyltransferase [Herbidospora mongoliensis]
MLIRRELPGDEAAIREVVRLAFATPENPDTIESPLVDELRADVGWIPALSMVAEIDGEVVGHVVCTRADLGGAPALGLGPLSVRPDRQRQGVGLALMHAMLGAADALGEPVVVLLGNPAYYFRYGFRTAAGLGIISPEEQWGVHFQARPLTSYRGEKGLFGYAEPFTRL